jgi:hypothetical protein
MKDFDSKWEQLVASARQAPVAGERAMPYGFATRVAAQAMNEAPTALIAMFGRFSVRALWLACLLTLASVAANYLTFAGSTDDSQSWIDPVSEVFTDAS